MRTAAGLVPRSVAISLCVMPSISYSTTTERSGSLSFISLRSVRKLSADRMIAISNRENATEIPIAPVFQMLAADAVPSTRSRLVRMAPPPINPIPVMIP